VKIIINDWQKKEKVRKGRLKTLAEKVLELEGCSSETEVGIVLTDNRKIRGLNKKYRKVDRATDVIAFPMESPHSTLPLKGGGFKEGELLGDVVISLERAKSQSREYKHSFEKELAVLVIHGLLHLLGYDHLKKSEAEVMAKRERAILKKVISTAEEGG
jgi:probable rRNA maturation factor